MRNKTDNDRLLDDVLTESASPDFRAAMLGETLRLVRRRRQTRHMRRAVEIFAVLGLLAVCVWQKNLPRTKVIFAPRLAVKIISQKNYELMQTRPLPAGSIVSSQPLVAREFFVSTAKVKMVQTTRGNFRAINDEELLDLVASHPAILIRTGKNSEQLVFADPEDAKGFPRN